jgi:xanthine dehydrogenase YagS FAD-binding subunit
MNPFHYTRVEDSSAAIAAIGQDGRARFVAGGTNILDLMKIYVEEPTLLVDINRLPLAKVEQRGDSVHIGALARMSDVAADATVRRLFPMVALALEASASPQLRNMASMGGNLMQRTRCSYFRDTATPCNKRAPGSGCGALGGENRMNAVLGTSEHCIATHASDVAVPLMALDAVLHVAGANGTRDVPLRDFYLLPGNAPQIETVLVHGDLITGVSVPVVPFAFRSTYLKVRDRAQYEFALASAAVALDITGGTIQNARIALGGVATIPWRAREAERVLVNAPATRGSFARAAEAALSGAHGHGKNDYKIALAKRTLVRALEMVASA